MISHHLSNVVQKIFIAKPAWIPTIYSLTASHT